MVNDLTKITNGKSNGVHTTPKVKCPDDQGLSYRALFFMALLSLQFGIQPIVTKRFTSPTIIKSTVLLTQEAVKLVIALFGITMSNRRNWKSFTRGWTVSSWLRLSLLPATIYLMQNMCSLFAYQNLDAITYNVLNQTKTLSAALCCYCLLGKRQSGMQMFSLVILSMAALVIEGVLPIRLKSSSALNYNNYTIDSSSLSPRRFTHGVLPIIVASFLSGLAGALTQQSLQCGNRNALFFTIELCVASILLLLLSFVTSNDGIEIQKYGFFHQWTWLTLLPILTNSAGGILVGLVIKYAGTVQKGFALIFGILVSGILQSWFDDSKHLSHKEVVGGVLAVVSLWIHSTYPYVSVSIEKSLQEKCKADLVIGSRFGRKLNKED